MRSTTELIEHKRDGGELTAAEIDAFLSGAVAGTIPRYQVSAMLMAIYFQGMSTAELALFTTSMINSGERLSIATDLPKVDKHSTGGVGDKISIPLAPLVASCGVVVPMMSGRGLGHTGGTLDKLESIPGYRTALTADEFQRLAVDVGVVMAGQSDQIVPADRLLYSLRDTSGTVPSIPLISSSIMSKKLAEDLDALVLDIKVGDGAFMGTTDAARTLARTMIELGAAHGVAVRAFLTAMDQPIGTNVGNALEIVESIDVLRGHGPADTTQLVMDLGAAMLEAAGIEDGRSRLEEAIASGAAIEKFGAMIRAQGGDDRVIDDPSLLPRANHQTTATAAQSGFVQAISAREIGLAGVDLGAGRRTVDDELDLSAGFVLSAKVGASVEAGDVLATIHASDSTLLEHAARRVEAAYAIGESAPASAPLVTEEVT